MILNLQTLIVHSPRTSALIYNLSGFSLYYFYLLVQYGKTNITGYSDFSDAAVSTLQTKVAGEKVNLFLRFSAKAP